MQCAAAFPVRARYVEVMMLITNWKTTFIHSIQVGCSQCEAGFTGAHTCNDMPWPVTLQA